MGLKKKGLEGGIKQRCRVGKNGYGVEKKSSRAGKNMCRVGKNDCRVGKETWGLKKTNLGLEKKDPGDTTGRVFHKLGGGLEKQDLEGGVQI